MGTVSGGDDEVFFFKQKPACGMLRSMVGSEMCIGDGDVVFRGGGCVPGEVVFRGRLCSGGGCVPGDVVYTHLMLPTNREG